MKEKKYHAVRTATLMLYAFFGPMFNVLVNLNASILSSLSKVFVYLCKVWKRYVCYESFYSNDIYLFQIWAWKDIYRMWYSFHVTVIDMWYGDVNDDRIM